jgi:hypothetical protein
MAEVQKHGFIFEKWVRDTLFGGYQGKYMQKWDVPPYCNKHPKIAPANRRLPVSIKAAKFGRNIDLADALRQRKISRSFILIVGFWTQRTASKKWFETIGVVRFTPKKWSQLWGRLTIAKVAEFDALVKDRSVTPEKARKRARKWKSQFYRGSGSRIGLHQKIDSKTQRRVQCSMRFKVFWELVGKEPVRVNAPKLYGFPFRNPILSRARSIKKKKARG